MTLLSVLLLCVAGDARADAATFVLYRDHGAVRLLTADGRPTFATGLPPYLAIERRAGRSRATLYQRDDGTLTIWFNVDLPGPDWLYVRIDCLPDGRVTVQLDHSKHRQLHEVRWYLGWDAMLVDDRDANADLIATMLVRLGQNPRLPDRRAIGVVVHGRTPAPDPSGVRRCLAAIGQLDHPDHARREAAHRDLSRPDVVVHLPSAVARVELSPEQQARVAAVLRDCSLPDASPALVARLRGD